MNKKIIIGLLALFVLGGVSWWALQTPKNSAQKTAKQIMKGLDINQGIKCEQTVAVGENNSVHTTLYFYKDKMRYDTELANEAQGQKDFHAIIDGDYQYIWGQSILGSAMGGGQGGMKMKVGDEGAPKPEIDFDALKESDFNMPNVKCERWDAEQDMFDLPEGVEFKSMEEMMNPMMNMKDLSKPQDIADECAVCNMIPAGQAREDCKKSCSEDENK